MIYWMETVSLLLCPPKPSISSGESQTTCWISCLAKVLKVERNILPGGDLLTIQHLAAFDRPAAHQKANLLFWGILLNFFLFLKNIFTILLKKKLKKKKLL